MRKNEFWALREKDGKYFRVFLDTKEEATEIKSGYDKVVKVRIVEVGK